ncbi:MAG: M28 family peptidase, partial [Planctomycetota bacterium]
GMGYVSKRVSFQASGTLVHNVEVELPGKGTSDKVVVVGAHYDSTPEHGCPAADDNATGVAATLALARVFAGKPRRHTIRFVFFVNEEPPFFQTELMGSWVYARHCKARGDDVIAMLSLECMGYFSDAKGSQAYPKPLNLFYPSEGNFIAFVGNVGSRPLVRRAVKSFREHARFPSEGAALPSSLPGVGWSDHWAFWQEGYPAIMVTDTAPFRNPHYHEATDTIETLDFDRFARVTEGLESVIDELAGGE